jgi:hypothetical protein
VDKDGLLLPIISTFVKVSKIGDALHSINEAKSKTIKSIKYHGARAKKFMQ